MWTKTAWWTRPIRDWRACAFISMQNANGELDIVGSYIEPDDYDPGQNLSDVLTGVTLSLADQTNTLMQATRSCRSVDSQRTGDNWGPGVRVRNAVDFFYDATRLRIDFDQPVSSVAIDFAGSRRFAIGNGNTDRL